MNKREDPTGAGSPPKPSSPPIPGPGNPPQAPAGPLTPSKPGDPINVDMGLIDPRVLSPAPDLSPGLGTSLNLEPLTGPTEASEPEEESEVLDLEKDDG